jgi:hypothetical protein
MKEPLASKSEPKAENKGCVESVKVTPPPASAGIVVPQTETKVKEDGK